MGGLHILDRYRYCRSRSGYSATLSRSGGMADATVSKTVARKGVWVRLPPSAPHRFLGKPAERQSPHRSLGGSGHNVLVMVASIRKQWQPILGTWQIQQLWTDVEDAAAGSTN